jgi:prepilin-type N-terminal cleavage/methylation domain-containing protein
MYNMLGCHKNITRGFTIVELLVVIVVIGILAGLVIVSFAGVSQQATVATLNSDLKNAATQLEIDKTNSTSGAYPISEAAANGGNGLPKSNGTNYFYYVTSDYQSYLLIADAPGVTATPYISSTTGVVGEGDPYALPAGLLTNLVSYWPLDETSGTRYDAQGSNDLTDYATVTSRTGKQSSAASFDDATSEYLAINSDPSLYITNSFTISFWLYLDDISGVNTLISKWANGGGNQQEWILYMNGGTFLTYIGTTNNITTTFAAGQWYHVAITGDASANLTLYVNNSVAHTVTNSGYRASGTSALRFGTNSATNFFDGSMDEVALWSRTLSAGEVAQLYNFGLGSHI